MATTDIKATNVIKIDPSGKYVISFSGPPPSMAEIAKIREWWNDSDDPVLFIPDFAKLVRVDESAQPAPHGDDHGREEWR